MDASQAEGTVPPPTEPSPPKAKASLLPAFEPLSSSPALPRPGKRSRDALEDFKYPTPVPSSSTAILSSSPSRQHAKRPGIQRTLSTVSERAPLSTVPTVQLEASGKPILMGRSSASCDYQLPNNRSISRIHVEALYKPALSRLERDRVVIKCLGWNGIKVHSQSQVHELNKGDTFNSDVPNVDIMVDVRDTRVIVQWPDRPRLGPISSDEEDSSPSKKQRPLLRHSTPPSPSPEQTRRHPVSPISPSPAVQSLLPSSPPLLPNHLQHPPVQIYEDPVSDRGEDAEPEPVTQSTQVLTQGEASKSTATDSMTSIQADFSDNDEENDPVIHSFGPFGANLLPRMASFTTGSSPQATFSPRTSRSSHAEPLRPIESPSQVSNPPQDLDVREHIINQLAFSRLSSTPLSTIFSHLPSNTTIATTNELRAILKDTECIGEVTREGKDAAGKPLESEFYYIPDQDGDEKRKEAVVNDLMKPGLRACRKQHKQYFWRKPKKA